MKIVGAMQFVPAADGTGGEQRAWFLAQALARIGELHLLILQPSAGAGDRARAEAASVPGAASLTVHHVPEWSRLSALRPAVHPRLGAWADYLRMGTPHTPRLPAPALRAIADRLPAREADVLFAGRLPAALILDGLADAGLLSARRRIVDFDDILSKFFAREGTTISWAKPDRRLGKMIDVRLIEAAERRVLARWDAASVCSEVDVAALEARAGRAEVLAVPNVVDRPLLPPPERGGQRILFVGNLAFGPNAQGLERFLDAIWPRIRRALPEARLQVVGLNPPPSLLARLQGPGIDVDANVPSVEPFYRKASLVVAPIYFGGGTRIKILEAMAYGRAVVATPIGAEGLGLSHGDTAMIAEADADFADAVTQLLRDASAREALAERARRYQQQAFGPAAMAESLRAMIEGRGPWA